MTHLAIRYVTDWSLGKVTRVSHVCRCAKLKDHDEPGQESGLAERWATQPKEKPTWLK